MRQKLINFMQGRYGSDELNICLIVLAAVFSLLSPLWSMFSSLSMVCIIYALFRMLSKNIYQRRRENAVITPYISFIRAKIKNKGKSRIYLCNKCKRTLRVPRGKGKITINCPCGHSLKRKS